MQTIDRDDTPYLPDLLAVETAGLIEMLEHPDAFASAKAGLEEIASRQLDEWAAIGDQAHDVLIGTAYGRACHEAAEVLRDAGRADDGQWLHDMGQTLLHRAVEGMDRLMRLGMSGGRVVQ